MQKLILNFRRNNGEKAFRPLLTEKIGGGVSLPYLQVKKNGKTYYLPMIKNDTPKIISRFFGNMTGVKFKFTYKGEEYFPLFCRSMNEIGVITLVNGKIHQSLNFKNKLSIFFNKAKRLALYSDGRKLMDINYDDVITMMYNGKNNGNIVNLTTGKTVNDDIGYEYLEFREE